ncbi:uncharacterized protein LOC126482145 [Schistocerca serialis cubense]|uniref:uncharacterized protein LOC126482145 n=1 Tax=Schistocerca serialis cubense TaxID=2023355 RepID=UPI00214E84A7|nr:uncharacterized protein LOC126482145 [Schistocerca serialis cubense]
MMALQNERRTVVPWFSMAEWDATYKNIYSSSTELQFMAYERLLVWKARCQRLPLAVECTMGMLQVLIKDKQLVAQIDSGFMHPYQEHDLRLQYSTSVMRFLNQIAVLTKSSSDTLYQAARKMHVPDWLVGLRHDIAHGTTLPSLALLRKAAQFALTWLHEYYWKGEATASSDFVVAEGDLGDTEDSEELKELLEMWQALKLYSLAEYEHLGQIPDGPLRKFLKQITAIKDAGFRGARNEVETFLANTSKKKQPKGIVNADELMPLKNAAESLEKKLLNYIKRNKCSPVIRDKAVDYLLSGQVFIPPAGIWNMFTADSTDESDHLAPWLIEIWSPMLNLLQQNLNILPTLLCRLASATADIQLEQHQQRVAALWMRELFAACAKSQLILKAACSEFSWCDKNVPKELWSKAERLVVKKQPHFERIISLRISELPDATLSVDDVKEILLSPSSWTHLFLPEMLELVSLPQRVRESLISLVCIYTQDLNVYDVDPEEDTDDEEVHTVADLASCIPEAVTEEMTDFVSNAVVEEHSMDDTSATWSRSCGNFDWTRCPLGLLPWQKGNNVLDLDFNSDVSWQSFKLQEPGEPKSCDEHDLPSQIDWNKILKKRIRKGRVTKRKKKINNVLKNAFQMVYKAT